ncbi:MAG: hypothetical protein U9R42_06825 [Bacteroidota bacterium]|nr:hypothetical protein [Bacteroidota bacterium]
MKSWINKRLDDFFDENGNQYLNMEIFNDIFDKLETKEYKIDNPDLYDYELRRIRDLHNSFTYALEKGYEKGRKSIEDAIKMLEKGLEVSLISEITGLTEKEINELKNK